MMQHFEFLSEYREKLVVYPNMVRCLGAREAIFVNQVIYWMPKTWSEDNWVYKTMDEWSNETGMSKKELETVRKNLRQSGVLEEKEERLVHRKYYRIVPHVLNRILDENRNVRGATEASNNLPKPPSGVSGKSEDFPNSPTEASRNSYPGRRDAPDGGVAYTEITSDTTFRNYVKPPNPSPEGGSAARGFSGKKDGKSKMGKPSHPGSEGTSSPEEGKPSNPRCKITSQGSDLKIWQDLLPRDPEFQRLAKHFPGTNVNSALVRAWRKLRHSRILNDGHMKFLLPLLDIRARENDDREGYDQDTRAPENALDCLRNYHERYTTFLRISVNEFTGQGHDPDKAFLESWESLRATAPMDLPNEWFQGIPVWDFLAGLVNLTLYGEKGRATALALECREKLNDFFGRFPKIAQLVADAMGMEAFWWTFGFWSPEASKFTPEGMPEFSPLRGTDMAFHTPETTMYDHLYD